MHFEVISSNLSTEEIKRLEIENEILLLNPEKTGEEQLKLAYELCKKSIENKTNLAKKEKLEFLLWLSAKKDIGRAIEEMRFKDRNEILLVSFTDNSKDKIKLGKKIKYKLKKKATSIELEEMSLSRI
jgi:tRNA threonylcarbamoyladenosine modification (KEOPS) complex Cgi121 subunit